MVDCPKHGHLRLVEKINVSKSKKYSKFGIINGYYCKDCNKYYIDVNGIKEDSKIGYWNHIPVINIHKYRYLPSIFFVLTKKSLRKMEKDKKVKSTFVFTTETSDEIKINSKYDQETKQYYITCGTLKSVCSILKKNKVSIMVDDDAMQELKSHKEAYEYAIECGNINETIINENLSDFLRDKNQERKSLPEKFIVLTKSSIEDMNNNSNLKSVNDFDIGSRFPIQIPSKYDVDTDEFYITDGTLKYSINIIKQNKIKIVVSDEILLGLKANKEVYDYAIECGNNKVNDIQSSVQIIDNRKPEFLLKEIIVQTMKSFCELRKPDLTNFCFDFKETGLGILSRVMKYDATTNTCYIEAGWVIGYISEIKQNNIILIAEDSDVYQELKEDLEAYSYVKGCTLLKEGKSELGFKYKEANCLPNDFVVARKEYISEMNKNNQLKEVKYFITPSYEIVNLPTMRKTDCGVYYITCETLIANIDFIDQNDLMFFVKDKTVLPIIAADKKTHDYLVAWGYPEIDDYCSKSSTNKESTNKDSSIDITNLKQNNKVAVAYNTANIRYNPYQYLPWLYMYNEGNKSILISDEVGLGKTIEAGILVSEELSRNENSKVLIVCPAFLKFKWKEELFDKFHLRSSIYDLDDSNAGVIILPLSKLNKFNQSDYEQYDMLIVDEAHYFKNSSSARYKHLSNLIKKKSPSNRVFMTATPINNKEDDYDSIKKLLGNRFSTTSTTKRQAYINIPRRMIKEVYLDLSPYEQGVYDVTDDLDSFSGAIYRHIGASCLYALMQYAQKYSSNESEVKQELKTGLEELLEYDYDEEKDIQDMSSKLSEFRLDGQDSKLDKLIEVIDEIEDNKIIIFSHYIETVKYLKSELSDKYNCEYIYGNNFSNHTVLTNKKNRFIDAKIWFEKQDSSKKTILICSDTCKEGIDLDAASCLINYDLPFNPSILEQRIGRIDRMCQKKNMKIFNFHVNNTYDDRLHMILSSKLLIIDYYSEYGIGNPLSIVENSASPFDKFISYFKKNTNISMSNDDFSVIKKILRKINITTPKKIKQEEILDILIKNKNKVIELFDEKEIDDFTDEQLKIQRDLLDKKLGFPKYSSETLSLDISSIRNIVQLLSERPSLRSRLSSIIIDYDTKIRDMEDTGNPMVIEEDDIKSSITFSSNAEDNYIFISRDTINLLKEQGGFVNEN